MKPVRTTSMGKEVQRIGLGYERSSRTTRNGKLSLRQWFGRLLERFGRRLMRASVSA